MISRLLSATLVALAFGLPLTGSAHHSPAEYDRSTITEFEGEVVNVFWRNPHVLIEVARTGGGAEAVWELEGAAVSHQRRRGVTADLVNVGDQVRVAGFASMRRANHMLAEHVLLPGGTEVLLGSSREPRWSEAGVGSGGWVIDPERAARAEGDGIFRVWSRGAGIWPWYFREPAELELTDWALSVHAGFDQFEDNPLLDCTKPGMPALMGNPYPMEFVQVSDDVIEARFEEFDVVRRIHLTDGSEAASMARSPLGYSVGRWDGNTLVVETTRINWPHFGRIGIPQSESVDVLERFTLVDDGARLDYALTIIDPEVLLEPFQWDDLHWIWRPGEQVGRYQCTVGE